MALELNGTTGVSLVQDGVVTAADLASTLDLTGKTVTLQGQIISIHRDVDAANYSLSATAGVLNNNNNVNHTPQRADTTVLVFVTVYGYVYSTNSDNDARTGYKVGTVDSSGTVVYEANETEDIMVGYTNITTTTGAVYTANTFVISDAERNSSGNVVVRVYGDATLDPGVDVYMNRLESVFVEVLL